MPSESTFFRFIDRLSKSEYLEEVFHNLVIKAKELNIIDGEHISIEDLVKFTKKNKLRVITSSYMGASDYKAILEFSKLPILK